MKVIGPCFRCLTSWASETSPCCWHIPPFVVQNFGLVASLGNTTRIADCSTIGNPITKQHRITSLPKEHAQFWSEMREFADFNPGFKFLDVFFSFTARWQNCRFIDHRWFSHLKFSSWPIFYLQMIFPFRITFTVGPLYMIFPCEIIHNQFNQNNDHIPSL